uniref:VP3 n=2 Tax=Riboviria TaxID=2559587 RepID=A0A9E8M586_9VIRU|nr:VP3 [Fusarium pseudograminearum partitivirus 1]WAB00197.1 R2P2 [Fusarium pseudograminearum mycovirus]
MREILYHMWEGDMHGLLKLVTRTLEGEAESDNGDEEQWIGATMVPGYPALPARRADYGRPFLDVLRWATNAAVAQGYATAQRIVEQDPDQDRELECLEVVQDAMVTGDGRFRDQWVFV